MSLGLDSRRLLALVALVSIAASVARTVHSGQDLNYDLVSYHFYLGFSAFSDRLGLDYLAAGAAGYQSPLPYALLYLLDSAGVPPILNASLHAALHALGLVLLFLLTRTVLKGTPFETNRTATIALWLLGAVAPIYWQTVGTSFADPLTSALLLGAVWLVAESLPGERRAGSLPLLVLGACLAGLAVAARVHNAIFGVALGIALALVRFPQPRSYFRHLALFAAASAAAWLVCFTPWAWRLWREFGNPVFPLFNGFFASPDYPAANLHLVGFVPRSVVELALLPLRMASYHEWSFGEKPYPDFRPALLMITVVLFALATAYRRIAASPEAASGTQSGRLVVRFFFIAALLWLLTSSNSRYGLLLLLLIGPVCGVLLLRAMPLRYALLIAGVTVLLQGAQQARYFTAYRWASAPWGERYFDWQGPAVLAERPGVYLGFGYKNASTLAPRVHAGSRHVALVAQYSIGLDHPGAARVRAMIEAPPGPIYGAFDYYYTQQSDPAAKSVKTYFAEHLLLWGLEFAPAECAPVELKPEPGVYRGPPPRFIVCELRGAPDPERQAMLRRYREFEKLLAPLASCPRLLGAGVSIVRVHGQWQVTSFASAEHRLEFEDGGALNLQLLRPPYSTVSLGKVAGGKLTLRPGACLPDP